MDHEEDFLEEELAENEDTSEPQEVVSEDSVSSSTLPQDDASPISMVSPGVAKGVASLKALKLLKLKTILIFSGVLFVIIVFVSVLTMNEARKVHWEYFAPHCETMKVHFVHRSSADLNLSIEEYVEDMVYSLTKNMESPDRKLYQAIAITVRTQAQNGNCTLNVYDEANDYYTFEELPEDHDRYLTITQAVENVKGRIMTDETGVLDVNFESFCYSNIGSEGYEFQTGGMSIPTDWAQNQVHNSYFTSCPCNANDSDLESCWVEENYPEDPENPDLLYYDGGLDGSGLNVYVAYYMSLEYGYSDDTILHYFFPGEWEYKTIDKSSLVTESNTICSKMDFMNTPLSKSDFISRVTSYLSGKSSVTAQLFRENAGLVYDLGEQIGANPEMVYIIAEKEQGWKDTNFTLASYNFYGYGVYNGQNYGVYFSSFEDGVRTILKYVKNKGSLDAFTKVYSYLGTYLANPGSWGDGGCIYLKLPEIYGPNYARCNSSYSCASSKGGSGCVLTTDSEKQAYIDWQSSKILKIRKNIFNLSADSCNISGGIDGTTDGATFLNESISNFLVKNNTTLDEFNSKVIEQGCKYQGSGEGVAYVAATAVSELVKYGKKFHYTWGGMHVLKPSSYGVLSNWGPYGPDCSGFVSWALYNAGFTWRSLGATDWGNAGVVVNLGDSRIRVGDFIVTPGNRGWNHIVIITAIHADEGYYSVVEAKGRDYGVVFSKIPIDSTSSKKATLMSDYYASAAKSSEFSNLCSTRGY